MAGGTAEPGARTGGWTFLTNHAHVLLALAREPDARMRDVADTVGVTERAVQAIVADLEAGGYLTRSRSGRRNHYTVNPAGRFRHPAEADHEVGELLALFTGDTDITAAAPSRRRHLRDARGQSNAPA
jgi:DNA-binding MarR family transcriptional regulator